jgi:hypothetical protein
VTEIQQMGNRGNRGNTQPPNASIPVHSTGLPARLLRPLARHIPRHPLGQIRIDKHTRAAAGSAWPALHKPLSGWLGNLCGGCSGCSGCNVEGREVVERRGGQHAAAGKV